MHNRPTHERSSETGNINPEFITHLSLSVNDCSFGDIMNPEIEEQQRLASQFKDQLSSMEEEERRLNERIMMLEAKLVVQELQSKVKVKRDVINQLQNRISELEAKLENTDEMIAPQQELPQQDPPQRVHF